MAGLPVRRPAAPTARSPPPASVKSRSLRKTGRVAIDITALLCRSRRGRPQRVTGRGRCSPFQRHNRTVWSMLPVARTVLPSGTAAATTDVMPERWPVRQRASGRPVSRSCRVTQRPATSAATGRRPGRSSRCTVGISGRSMGSSGPCWRRVSGFHTRTVPSSDEVSSRWLPSGPVNTASERTPLR